MGLNIRLYGINSPKAITLSYKIGKTAGNESVIATGYTSYGSLYPASSSRNYTNDPIIFPDASFDTQYWFKLTYTGDTGDDMGKEFNSFLFNCFSFSDSREMDDDVTVTLSFSILVILFFLS